MKNLLALAENLHRKALAEFMTAKRNGMDEADQIQAAEKGWLAAHRATNALLAHFGKKVTAGTQRKQEDLIDLEKGHPAIRAASMVDKFGEFHSRLHVSAGYMDSVSAKVIERDLRAVGEYIEIIRRIISR